MSVRDINQEEFVSLIADNELVVIDCWATWCMPCKSFGEAFEEVSKDYPDILFCKLNVENNKDFTNDLVIKSVPTVMIIKEGTIIFKEDGTMPKKSLVELIENAKQVTIEQ